MRSLTTIIDLGECNVHIKYSRSDSGILAIRSIDLLSFPEGIIEDICRTDEAAELVAMHDADNERKHEERLLRTA